MSKTLMLPLTVVLFLVSQGCGHKKDLKPFQTQQLQSKQIALAEIRGAAGAKKQVEVALVNEIIEEGRFQIVDRATVQEALTAYPHESDWQRLGQKVGADYVMSLEIAEYGVRERQGHDKVEEDDSQLAADYGTTKPMKATRYVKVKSFEGFVKVNGLFFDVAENAIVYKGAGTASRVQSSRGAAPLGKLRLLEDLSAKAIRNFFENMPKD